MKKQKKMKKLIFELAEVDYYEQTGRLPNVNQLKKFIDDSYSVENIKHEFMHKITV